MRHGRRQGEMGTKGRGRGWTLMVGVGCGVLALTYEFLWVAREPHADGLAFVVRRLGIHVVLGHYVADAFAFASLAIAIGCVAASWLAVRRVVFGRWGGWSARGSLAFAGAMLVLLFFAVPWHHVAGWVHDGLYKERFYDAAWSRGQFLKEAGLGSAARLFWAAALVGLGGFVVTGFSLRPPRLAGRLANWIVRHSLAFSAVAAGTLGLLAGLYTLTVLRGEPLHPDAGAYYFQAKVFASGKLTSPLRGGREFFDPTLFPAPSGCPFAFVGHRFFCVGLPVAPACYALGLIAGVPWIVAPLLGAATVVCASVLARECFGPGAGALAGVFVAISPWAVFMSADYLTHVPGAFLGLLFLFSSLRALRCRSWRWAVLAGLALGAFANTRVVTALGACVPMAVRWLVWLAKRPREAWRPTLAFAVALALFVGGLLAYNAATTGRPLVFGYQVASEGFAHRRNAEASQWHWTPVLGLANVAKCLHGLARGTFRWPIPWLGLGLAMLIVARKAAAPQEREAAILLALTVVFTCLAYAPVGWVPVWGGGPRYAFEVAPVAIVLFCGALVSYGRLVTRAGFQGGRFTAVSAAVVLFSVGYGLRWTLGVDLAYLRSRAKDVHAIFGTIEAQARPPALVFLPMRASEKDTGLFYLAMGRNDPQMRGPLVYARDLGPGNAALAADLPARRLYRWLHEEKRLVELSPLTLRSPTRHSRRKPHEGVPAREPWPAAPVGHCAGFQRGGDGPRASRARPCSPGEQGGDRGG